MDNLAKARAVAAKAREAGTLERLSPIERAKRQPKSLRLAINGKCWDCTCGQVKEIRYCKITKCTLWSVRPYQRMAAERQDFDE